MTAALDLAALHQHERHWRTLEPCPGYPSAIPFERDHLGAAYDYSDPRHGGARPGVFARFARTGAPTYRGDDAPEYRLDPR